VLVAAVGVPACSLAGGDQRGRPTDLVTRTSLGLTHAYGAGLRFDLVGSKVVFIALVLRTN
jgi:hypothetical protein